MQRCCYLQRLCSQVGIEPPNEDTAYIAGLAVQSWLNGWNPQPSSCPPQSQFKSLNIRHIYIRQALRGWPSTLDHAKWALGIPNQSIPSADGILAVCISDMNRMLGQMVRGGGAVCFTRRPALWESFRSIIDTIEGCFWSESLSHHGVSLH